MAKKSVVNTTKEKEAIIMNGYQNNSVMPMNTSGYEMQGVMVQPMVQPYPYDYSRVGNSTLALSMHIDMAEVLQVQANSMVVAYNLGANSVSVVPQSNSNSFSMEGYLGVYDDSAYGVYSSAERYESSKMYWHDDSLCKRIFPTYEEALAFAKAGVVALSGLNERDIPPLKVDCNWRQKIFEKATDG